MKRQIEANDSKDQSDAQLIAAYLKGDPAALETLVLRHQAWIYNLAFKMVMNHDDAGDITQDILLKAIKALASYDADKGAFRTWLYRITVNHVLSMKKKRFEYRIDDIDTYVSLIEKMPDDQNCSHPEKRLLEEEIKTGCMMGMIMCLNRRERLVFIIGGIFGLPDTEGGEIMDISRDNFRQILSRSRKKIHSHVKDFCGHVDANNPCRCAHKVNAFLTFAMADPQNLRYHHPERPTVKEVAAEKYGAFRDLYYEPFFEFYRQQPFYESPDMVAWLRDMTRHKQFQEIFNL